MATRTMTIPDKRMLKFFRKQFAYNIAQGLKIKVGEQLSVSGNDYASLLLHACAISHERTALRSVTATREQVRALARETKTATKNGNRVAVFFDGTGCEQVSREARSFHGECEWPVMMLKGEMTAKEIEDKIEEHNAYVASV